MRGGRASSVPGQHPKGLIGPKSDLRTLRASRTMTGDCEALPGDRSEKLP